MFNWEQAFPDLPTEFAKVPSAESLIESKSAEKKIDVYLDSEACRRYATSAMYSLCSDNVLAARRSIAEKDYKSGKLVVNSLAGFMPEYHKYIVSQKELYTKIAHKKDGKRDYYYCYVDLEVATEADRHAYVEYPADADVRRVFWMMAALWTHIILFKPNAYPEVLAARMQTLANSCNPTLTIDKALVAKFSSSTFVGIAEMSRVNHDAVSRKNVGAMVYYALTRSNAYDAGVFRQGVKTQTLMVGEYQEMIVVRLTATLMAAHTNVFSIPQVTTELGALQLACKGLRETYGADYPYCRVLKLPGYELLNQRKFPNLMAACVAYGKQTDPLTISKLKSASSSTVPIDAIVRELGRKAPTGNVTMDRSTAEYKAAVAALGYNPTRDDDDYDSDFEMGAPLPRRRRVH